MRNIIALTDGWQFTKENAGPVCPAGTQPVHLPHTWNAIDGQDGGNDYYRGTCWYYLELPEISPGQEVFLSFEGAAMVAEVYLNGEKLCKHEGGYSTFRVNVTEALQRGRALAVSVDNSDSDRVYPRQADFTFYGGLYRPVQLITVPKAHFDLEYHGGPGIRVTPTVKGRSADVRVEAWAAGGEAVTFTVNGQTRTVPLKDGKAEAIFAIESCRLWDGVNDPYLYTARAELVDGGEVQDEVSARFGCRTFEIDPEKGFLLNGRSYPLRGVSRHQDREDAGNALTPEMHREDAEIILEMGANFVRLAHYQHAQTFYDLCDELGLIAWAEIPYITVHMDSGEENTLSQMRELITQNYNHPSICCWGLSNEVTFAGETDFLRENHRKLNDLAHRLDPTRPTTMAHVFLQDPDSSLLDIPDLNAYNLYFGWYVEGLEKNEEFFDSFHLKHPEKPIGFSEYGADANIQFQTASPRRSDYTETYQCVYHEHILKMIETRPYIWMTAVWNMFDFAADGRDEGGAHGRNQKGMVTLDRKTRKDAFYLYKAHWSKEPFVHICGRRYVDRPEDVTQIKVYSNLPEVKLYCDGAPIAQQQGSRIFTFELPITGDHGIVAVAGDQTDEIRIRHVAEPNPDYTLTGGAASNWLDTVEINEGCYSLNDTLSEIKKNPGAAKLVEEFMDKAASTRGDVAKQGANNPMLETIMNQMTLRAILSQVGDSLPEEAVKAFIAEITGIRRSE